MFDRLSPAGLDHEHMTESSRHPACLDNTLNCLNEVYRSKKSDTVTEFIE